MTEYSVYLHGYWQHNLGDDLFLWLFMRKYPRTHIYLRTKTKYKKYYSHERITPVFEDSILFHIKNPLCKFFWGKGYVFYKIIPNVDCAVILGGSLFMEEENWKGYMAQNYSNLQKYAPKSYVLGCNFGPFETEEFLEYFSELIGKMDGVCLRDKYSVKVIKNNLIKNNIYSLQNIDKIRFAPDIAFQLLDVKVALPPSPYPDYYVISVINPEERIGLQGYGKMYKDAVLRLAMYLSDQNKEKAIVFYAVSNALGDEKIARELDQEMKIEGRKSVIYNYEELEESLSLIKNAKAVVATHFHTMLLALLYKVPVYPIIYNLKMKTVIEDYGFRGAFIELQKLTRSGNEYWLQEVLDALRKEPVISQDTYEEAKGFFQDVDLVLG